MAPLDVEGEASFLRGCITNKKTAIEIIKSLGLNTEKPGPGRLTFENANVSGLHKQIQKVVDDFIGNKGKTQTEQVAALDKETTFTESVEQLGSKFGDQIWGPERSHLFSPGQEALYPVPLFWQLDKDRKTIKFLIRCWIVKTASRRIRRENRKPRDGRRDKEHVPVNKGRIRTHPITIEVSDDETSDTDTDTENEDGPRNPTTPTGPVDNGDNEFFRAPNARMYPTPTPQPPANSSDGRVPAIARSLVASDALNESNSDDLYEEPRSRSTSPPSSAKKRKEREDRNLQASGKLPRLKDGWSRSIPEMIKQRQTVRSSVYVAPPPQAFPPFRLFGQRKQRENTQESDPSYVPSRDVSVETETEPDMDAVMEDANALVERNARETVTPLPFDRHILPTPQRHPSITSARHDSVIPISQDDGPMQPPGSPHEDRRAEPQSAERTEKLPVTVGNLVAEGCPPITTTISPIGQDMRRELFKLLLSRVNNINQFTPGSDCCDAEERLNHLLYHVWINERLNFEVAVGERYDRLSVAFERWMDMRTRLQAFQNLTRYSGSPGEEWRTHLRGIEDLSERAQACIALADLRSTIQDDRFFVGSSFNEDLTIVFDYLTMFPGCNGPEEFRGVERYNLPLLEWFT